MSDELRKRVVKTVARFCFNRDCQDEGCYDCDIVRLVMTLVQSETRTALASPVATEGEDERGLISWLGGRLGAECGDDEDCQPTKAQFEAAIRHLTDPTQPVEPVGWRVHWSNGLTRLEDNPEVVESARRLGHRIEPLGVIISE